MKIYLLCATLTTLAITSAFTTSPATAATASRFDVSQAADLCQPATYTVNRIRNRPTGVRNESTSGIYMTCAMVGDDSTARTGFNYFIRLTNQGATTATVNCTMTDGWVNSVFGAYPQSISVGAGSSDFFTWDSATLASKASWSLASFSCLLQPDVEINYIGKYYIENVGA